MRALLFALLLIDLLTFCSHRTEKIEEEGKEKITEDKRGDEDENSILGVWTDGFGPNASIRIENDSIYDVEHSERTKYELVGDSLTIHYEDEPFRARIIKVDADSLIYASKYGRTIMWRFKD